MTPFRSGGLVEAYKRLLRRMVDRQWLVAVGHYGWPAPLLVAVGMRFMPTQTAMTALLVPLLLFAFVVAVHEAGICPRCAPGMVPTFPSVEVERWRRVLRGVHYPLREPFTWVVLGVHAALTVAGLWWPLCGRLTAITVVVVFAAELGAVRVHHRLRPWCPDCSGRRDDDAPPAPPPGPGGLARHPDIDHRPGEPCGVGAGRVVWQRASTGVRTDHGV